MNSYSTSKYKSIFVIKLFNYFLWEWRIIEYQRENFLYILPMSTMMLIPFLQYIHTQDNETTTSLKWNFVSWSSQDSIQHTYQAWTEGGEVMISRYTQWKDILQYIDDSQSLLWQWIIK